MAYLHPKITAFFEEKMATHSQVERCTRMSARGEYIYFLVRKTKPRVIVFLSDAYDFGLTEYVARPPVMVRNSFILVARPEAHFDRELVARAKKDKIGIGKLAKMMGAMNYEKVYEYETAEEQEDQEPG